MYRNTDLADTKIWCAFVCLRLSTGMKWLFRNTDILCVKPWVFKKARPLCLLHLPTVWVNAFEHSPSKINCLQGVITAFAAYQSAALSSDYTRIVQWRRAWATWYRTTQRRVVVNADHSTIVLIHAVNLSTCEVLLSVRVTLFTNAKKHECAYMLGLSENRLPICSSASGLILRFQLT